MFSLGQCVVSIPYEYHSLLLYGTAAYPVGHFPLHYVPGVNPRQPISHFSAAFIETEHRGFVIYCAPTFAPKKDAWWQLKYFMSD